MLASLYPRRHPFGVVWLRGWAVVGARFRVGLGQRGCGKGCEEWERGRWGVMGVWVCGRGRGTIPSLAFGAH